MKKSNNIISNIYFIFKLILKVCPGRIFADFFVSAIGYISWVFYSIIFLKYILNAIENQKGFPEIAAFIAISSAIFGALSFFEKWYGSEYSIKTNQTIYQEINTMLFDKATEVELACYEDTEFYNNYTLAMKDADARIVSILSNVSSILFAVIAAIGVLYNMYLIDHFVVIFVAAPLIGNFVFGKGLNKVIYKRNVESVPYQRRMDYVNRTVYLRDYAKEIRMSSIFKVLKKTYEEGYQGVLGIINKFAVKAMGMHFWQNIFTFLIIFQGVMFYSFYRTMVSRTMSLSDFAVLTSAMVTASWILIGLSRSVIAVLENNLYIDNFKRFLMYESKLMESQDGLNPERPLISLELNNVSFTYKGQEKPSIQDISMKIHRGEKIALVGHNGAGKTTLIKLIMRLYDPDSGQITMNNKNIKEYNLKKYRSLFGMAFQDYQVFAMPVAENVLMREPGSKEDYEVVKKALMESGAYEKVLSLPKGVDTILTKEFDEEGVVLSGGELQKIAVARVFAKDFEIAIFDEPSSALDPIAEYNLYESMMKACKDKTVVFISHRLSSATLADKVYMLENGRIIEEGTHKELINKNGKYADMFQKQAEKYLEENYMQKSDGYMQCNLYKKQVGQV